VAVVPPPKPRATPDELYRSAEQALASRDSKAADRFLATLVADYPASSLVDQALYERARIAYQQRAWTVARGHLERLAAISDTRLAEPGHYLRCRIAVETRDQNAAACFTEYRTRFPRSPHDLEAVGFLAQHAYAKGGCARAAALVGELASAYPRTTLAAAWRTRCPTERP
jgi:TolA-binding protein